MGGAAARDRVAFFLAPHHPPATPTQPTPEQERERERERERARERARATVRAKATDSEREGGTERGPWWSVGGDAALHERRWANGNIGKEREGGWWWGWGGGGRGRVAENYWVGWDGWRGR